MTAIARCCRLLPLTAIVAAAFLVVQLSKIWTGATTAWNRGIVVAEAQASNSPSSPAAQSPAAPYQESANHSEVAPRANAMAPNHGDTDGHNAVPPIVSQGFTSSEITVLQQLAARREALAARAANIERRETLLKAAELRIDEKLEHMKKLQANLETLINAHDQQQESQILSLVKIYENMKAKDAARIFEQLDLSTLLEVAQRMKERKLAPILAKIDAAKAKEITEELAQLREIKSVKKGNILNGSS